MNTLEISSSTNLQFKIFKSLLSSKGIKEHSLFMLSGRKLIEEYLLQPSPQFKIEYVLYSQELQIEVAAKKTKLSLELFKELDVLGTHFNILVLSFSPLKEKDLTAQAQGLEIICPLGDPRNLGALMRSALGFGVSEMILTAEACHPYLPHSLKASAGAALKINLSKTQKRLAEIELTGENYALELHGTNLKNTVWPASLRLWLGEEGSGLHLSEAQKKKIKFVHIPTKNIESLNATVSSSLAIWEWHRSQILKL